MKPQGKKIKDWLSDIQGGLVQLPDFQREEVWDYKRVENFLWAVLQSRPLGILLALKVNARQEIQARAINTAPQETPKGCNQLILDGQQRLTALWRALNDTYEGRNYYVEFVEKSGKLEAEYIKSQKKSGDGKTQKEPTNSIPIQCLKPDDVGLEEMQRWLDTIKQKENLGYKFRRLKALLKKLRKRIIKATLYYYELPAKMEREEVIQIFMDTNTSSVELTAYDLAVALMNKKTKENLTDIVNTIMAQVPQLEKLETSVGEILLKIQCIRQGKKPSTQSFLEDLDFDDLIKNGLEEIRQGLQWDNRAFRRNRNYNKSKIAICSTT